MATVNTMEKHIASLEEGQRTVALDLVNYVKRLASMTNTNITRWDIVRLFSNDDGVLVSEKKEINKRFFDKLEKLANKKNEDEISLDSIPGLDAALEESMRANFEQVINQAKYEIKTNIQTVKNYYKSININLKAINDAKKRIAALEGKTPQDFAKKEISEILKEGVWTNPVIKDNFLYLNTASNIVLTHINRNAGINTQMDVGQFAVKINLSEFSMHVLPYKNNFMDEGEGWDIDEGHVNWGDGLWHPHVDQESNICWGNAYESAMEAIADQQLSKALKLLYAILTTYNDENPYVSLIDFAANNRKIVYNESAIDYEHIIHPENFAKVKEKSSKKKSEPGAQVCDCGDPKCRVNI